MQLVQLHHRSSRMSDDAAGLSLRMWGGRFNMIERKLGP
jgi:hypothetical protein